MVYTPMFGGREQIDVFNLGGGHGGGDPLLKDDLFLGPDSTSPVQRMAELEDGIEAVMTGLAVHQSVNRHENINVDAMRKRIFSNAK